MKPLWKWLIGILVLIVVALMGASWYVSRNWKPIIETELKALVARSTDSLYRLTYDELDMNLALGNITLKNAVFRADSQVYARMEATEDAPDKLYDIQVKALRVKRFSIPDALRAKQLHIRSVALIDPRIQLTDTYHAYNDTIPVDQPAKSLYERVQDLFTAVRIDEVTIGNAAFAYTKRGDGQETHFDVDSLQLHAQDILLDEHSQADSTRLYYAKQIDLAMPGLTYALGDGTQHVRFDRLKANTLERSLLLTQVDYQSLRSKGATRTEMHFDTLYIEQLDFKKLIEQQQTLAGRMTLKNGYTKLYSDKRYPKRPVNQIGKAPHQKLMQVKKRLHIDSVFVDDMDVVYGQMSAKYQRKGEISFNDITGTLTNVTNDTAALQKDPFMRADLRSKVMGSGRLHTTFAFDMLNQNGAYHYAGTLAGMNATAFNRILYPLLNVEIASGNIRGIRFNIDGTDYRSQGEFRFDYDHLAIDLKNDPTKPRKKSTIKIASLLVSKVIINDSNPDANEKYHIGRINYRRVPEHTFFKNLWQSLLEGIKQTAGISTEREATWRERAAIAKEKVAEAKEARQKTKGFFQRIFKKKTK